MQMLGPSALTENTLTAFTLGDCLLVAIESSKRYKLHAMTQCLLLLLLLLQLLLQLQLRCPKGHKMPAS